jgi:hypothetical protein
MTNEEFLELAKQNNAIRTPEESEKCRQDTAEFFERHKVTSDWLGNFYLVDTHNPIHRFADKVHTGICLGSVICIAPLLLFYGVFAIIVLLFLLSMLGG